MSLINDYENSTDPRNGERLQVPRVNVASATPAPQAPAPSAIAPAGDGSIEFGQPLPGSPEAAPPPELIPYDTTPYDDGGEEILPGIPLPPDYGSPTTADILSDAQQQAINVQRQRLESLQEPVLYDAPMWGTTPDLTSFPTESGLPDVIVPEGRSLRQLMENTPGGQRAPRFGNPLGNVGQSEPGQGRPTSFIPSFGDMLNGLFGAPENLLNSGEQLMGSIPGVGGALRSFSQAVNPYNWGQYLYERSQGRNHEEAWNTAANTMTQRGQATQRITGEGSVLDGRAYGGGALGSVFRGLAFQGNAVRGALVESNRFRNQQFSELLRMTGREPVSQPDQPQVGIGGAVAGQYDLSFMNPDGSHPNAQPQTAPAIPGNPLASLPNNWWGNPTRIAGGFILDALSEGGLNILTDGLGGALRRASTQAAQQQAPANVLQRTATEAQTAAVNQRIAQAEQRQAQRAAQATAETQQQLRAAQRSLYNVPTNVPGARPPANAAEQAIANQIREQAQNEATRGAIVRVVPGNLAQGRPDVTVIYPRAVSDSAPNPFDYSMPDDVPLFADQLPGATVIERAQLPGQPHTFAVPQLPGITLFAPRLPGNIGIPGQVSPAYQAGMRSAGETFLPPEPVRMLPAAAVENARIAGYLPAAPELTPRTPMVLVPEELPIEVVSRRVPAATERTLTEANAIYRQRFDLELDNDAFSKVQRQFQELQAQRKIDTTLLRDYVDAVADDLGQGTFDNGTIYDNILREIDSRYPRTVREAIAQADDAVARGAEPIPPAPERIQQYAEELAAEQGVPVDTNIVDEAGRILNEGYQEDLAIFQRQTEDDLFAAELAAQPEVKGGVRVFTGSKAQLPDGSLRSLVQAGTTRGDLGNGIVLYRNVEAARQAAEALPNKNIIYGELDVTDDGKVFEVQGAFKNGVDADAPLTGELLANARDTAKKLLPVMAYMDFKDSMSGMNLRQLYELFDEQATRFGMDKEQLGFVFRHEMGDRFRRAGYDHVFDQEGRLISLDDTTINDLETIPWKGDIDGYANAHNVNAQVRTKQTLGEAIRQRINYNDAVRQRLELRGRELKDTIMSQIENLAKREGELRARNFSEMVQQRTAEMRVAKETASYRVLEDIDTLDESFLCL